MAKQARKRSKGSSPAKRLAELQRRSPVVPQDRDYLRQPYRFSDDRSQDYAVETYTTYGAYQDPI